MSIVSIHDVHRTANFQTFRYCDVSVEKYFVFNSGRRLNIFHSFTYMNSTGVVNHMRSTKQNFKKSIRTNLSISLVVSF